MTGQPWFICFEPQERPQMRLFCFPYAGGSAAAFHSLATDLASAGCEVWAANLPGHGARISEAPLAVMGPLVEKLVRAVQPVGDRPFAFLGHSLGARLAFEASRVLRRRDQALPVHLFAAACAAPQLPQSGAWHKLSDQELVQELYAYNGLPDILLTHRELQALFLPALRADLMLFETAAYEVEKPFDFPITALGGNRDPLVNVKELEAWREQTTGPFDLILHDGDHFFQHEAQAAVIKSVMWRRGKAIGLSGGPED